MALLRNLDIFKEEQANRVTESMSRKDEIRMSSSGSMENKGLSRTRHIDGMNMLFSSTSSALPLSLVMVESGCIFDVLISGYTVSSAMMKDLQEEKFAKTL